MVRKWKNERDGDCQKDIFQDNGRHGGSKDC